MHQKCADMYNRLHLGTKKLSHEVSASFFEVEGVVHLVSYFFIFGQLMNKLNQIICEFATIQL